MSETTLFDQIMIEFKKQLTENSTLNQSQINEILSLFDQPKLNLEALTKIIENATKGTSDENS